ncbi:HEPN domain-containing protein [Aquimarina muelleri]|uniref:RiboL-PSP-HEPN domain-containing protein n=1 Tax=Aquimarina muelleri TaxID=279356 RepID=A0A918N2K5_9FLAO|nr:HEPN domain-containing protein [Aquimarina muelleri]MCX2764601.1 HEPN domain-containing protein [Aquimarina muelleri]GGX19322.1 hypothetical protein GCM10007384_20850 [Aquimarina muelleri]
MQHIFDKYKEDLNEIKKTISLLNILEDFAKEPNIEVNEESDSYLKKANKVKEVFKENRSGVTFIPGILMLYIAGRFENYIRTIFEETSTNVAKAHLTFKDLNKEFQNSLINDTSKVIANPRKYNHGDGARDTFIKILYSNIHENKLDRINYQCLSSTDMNMRTKVITELFKKINYKNIWTDISAQANLRSYFGGIEPNKTMSESQKRLDSFMDIRNSIAHQSDTVTWMSTNDSIGYIDFFIELGYAIGSVCPLHISKTQNEFRQD